MKFIIAGLETNVGLAYIKEFLPLRDDMHWQETAGFFSKAENEADEERSQRVWLYRAPWALRLNLEATRPCADIMHHWQDCQRRIVLLWHRLQNSLVLANIDRVDSHALVQQLGTKTFGARPQNNAGPAANPYYKRTKYTF